MKKQFLRKLFPNGLAVKYLKANECNFYLGYCRFTSVSQRQAWEKKNNYSNEISFGKSVHCHFYSQEIPNIFHINLQEPAQMLLRIYNKKNIQ